MDDLASSVNSIVMYEDDHLNNTNYSTKNIASNIHPRLDAFKKKSKFISDQEERRKDLLVQQKKKRVNLTDANRNISNSTKRYYTSPFSNKLMLSEWLEQIDESDRENNWIMCICPVGKRCLVVASEGITSVYNKAGRLIARHSSKLPGGSRENKTDQTIIDCIYNEILRTYFILDILEWKLKNHPMTDSESEFRFYWIKCKLDEQSDLNLNSRENPYKFCDLPRLNKCSSLEIQKMFEKPYEFEIDGVLFYHKEGHYHQGYATPLSLWLKAYMIPDILKIPLLSWITQTAPSDYINNKFYEE